MVTLGFTFRRFLSPGVSSEIQTLDLSHMSPVFCHCATTAQPNLTVIHKRRENAQTNELARPWLPAHPNQHGQHLVLKYLM
jgi:hypothetical protein